MHQARPLITLMTDFGREDVYVGVMKGVIARIAPHARVLDLTHSIPAFDVLQAAHRLSQAHRYFPDGTIHVIVVDPGVGSERSVVALRSAEQVFLAPDNGVLTLIERENGHDCLVEVRNPEYFLPEISSSFHGRDIFAPAAAHLARGVPLPDLGPPLEGIEEIDVPQPEIAADGSIRGTVLWCDHFGNLVTNIGRDLVESVRSGRAVRVRIGAAVLDGLVDTYAQTKEGRPLAMTGSFGALEIAVRMGSATERLNAGPGTPVFVTFE